MKSSFYKSMIEKSPNACACHKILCDREGKPYDYECVEANQAFLKITGLQFQDVIGKRIMELLPGADVEHNWLAEFAKVALAGETIEFELPANIYKYSYRVKVFSPEDYYFVTIFSGIPVLDEQILASENKYKLLVDNMAENLWVIDLDNRFTYISPSVRNVLGYTAEETIVLRPEQILTEESYEEMMALFRQALEEDRLSGHDPELSWYIEAKSRRKDGSYNWTRSTIRILRDENLEPIGFMGISRDITEEKQVKEALQRSEEQLRLILDSCAEAVFGTDIQGNCTFCNTSCLKLLGYTDEKELLGKSLHQLAHYQYPDGRTYPQKECPVHQAISNGEALHLDNLVFWRSDGTSFSAELFAHPQYRDKKLVGAVITFFDITKRKKMEEKLRESERIKDLLLTNLPGMVYKINCGPKPSLEYVSEGCLALTGYDAPTFKEIINKSLADPSYLTEYAEYVDLICHIQRRVAQALTSQSPYTYREEFSVVTAQGDKKWVLDQGKGLYNDKGELLALDGLVIDITDRKQKEEESLFLTNHDTLTGLYNRFYYQQALQKFDRREYLPLSVIVADINGLKLINDAFGHNLGDKLIIDSARILRSCCREDDVVARIGGDEFCILLPRTDSVTAARRLKKIQNTCARFNSQRSNKTYTVDIALGYGTKNDLSEDLSEVIKHAEDNMYKQKLIEHYNSRSKLLFSIKKHFYERTKETEEHIAYLRSLAHALGNKMCLSKLDLDRLLLLATLYDIGEVGLDERILTKPEALTAAEWGEVKKHPETGYRIAMSCQDFKDIAEYILAHHERWDGLGYPQGLADEEIPLLSRIIAVIDAYDAMTQPRPYRPAYSREYAINELKKNMGSQFDPQVTQAFLELLAENPSL